jgi:hypothetical protein
MAMLEPLTQIALRLAFLVERIRDSIDGRITRPARRGGFLVFGYKSLEFIED